MTNKSRRLDYPPRHHVWLHLWCYKWWLDADVAARRDERKIQQQSRMHSGGRISAYNPSGSDTGASEEAAAMLLIQQYAPMLIGAAVVGVVLICLCWSRRGDGMAAAGESLGTVPCATLAARAPARSRGSAWLIISAVCGGGGLVALAVGLISLATMQSRIDSAKRTDQLDLESRTVRSVPSPYGGTMTVRYGPLTPERTIRAEQDFNAKSPYSFLFLEIGGTLLLVGLCSCIYGLVCVIRSHGVS
jgi:hypothetical protein